MATACAAAAPGVLCCPGMDECRGRMDALERPSRGITTSLYGTALVHPATAPCVALPSHLPVGRRQLLLGDTRFGYVQAGVDKSEFFITLLVKWIFILYIYTVLHKYAFIWI